ncbi:L-type lectin-domain containing receptor kinase VIII.2 [Nymphaea colorata]|uniref:L-type lectin-domain containing receptor kinase VIII.2 n=1 Tax=Nymphaea colorata TaxID=210225 RepID=UPI00129D383C|nr:L-type lectin-domain containing receptor kinase VIII.2 [Nymphaea colorata]
MAVFFILRYLFPLTVLSLVYVAAANLNSSSEALPFLSYQPTFDFPKFGGAQGDLGISLSGDAWISPDVSAVRITNGSSPSSGRVLYESPIEMFRGDSPRTPISFLSCFSFSMSPGNGARLAFAFTPRGFSFFDGWEDGSSGGNLRAFVVRFDASSGFISTRVSDAPTVGLVVNGGEQLNCSIEYDSNSRVVDVRIRNSSEFQSFTPVISYSADLSRLWAEEMFVSIGASSSNSSQIATLYSWSFSKRYSAYTLHSEPLDPNDFPTLSKESVNEKRRSSVAGIFAALLVGAAFGAVAAIALLLLRSRFAKKNSVAPVMADPVDLECDVKIVSDKCRPHVKK